MMTHCGPAGRYVCGDHRPAAGLDPVRSDVRPPLTAAGSASRLRASTSRLRASTASSMPALAAVVGQRQASTSSGGSSRVASRSPRLYWALVWPALTAVVSGARHRSACALR